MWHVFEQMVVVLSWKSIAAKECRETGIDRERRFDEACGREDTHRIPLLIGLSTGEGSRVVHFDNCPSIRVDVG